jgi:hypothetical protein
MYCVITQYTFFIFLLMTTNSPLWIGILLQLRYTKILGIIGQTQTQKSTWKNPESQTLLFYFDFESFPWKSWRMLVDITDLFTGITFLWDRHDINGLSWQNIPIFFGRTGRVPQHTVSGGLTADFLMTIDQDMSWRNFLMYYLFNSSSKFKKHEITSKWSSLSLNFYGNLPNVGITSESVIDHNFAWEHAMNTSTVKSILYIHFLWTCTDSYSDRVILYDLWRALCMVFSTSSITTWSSANINVFVKFLSPNRCGKFRVISCDFHESTHGLVKFTWSWKTFPNVVWSDADNVINFPRKW